MLTPLDWLSCPIKQKPAHGSLIINSERMEGECKEYMIYVYVMLKSGLMEVVAASVKSQPSCMEGGEFETWPSQTLDLQNW